MDDQTVRDRLARAEQNIINHEKNFSSFKQDDFQGLKAEVHSMRGEFNKKLDDLAEKMDSISSKVSEINLLIAKWTGMGIVVFFVGKVVLDKFFL